MLTKDQPVLLLILALLFSQLSYVGPYSCPMLQYGRMDDPFFFDFISFAGLVIPLLSLMLKMLLLWEIDRMPKQQQQIRMDRGGL